MNMKKNGKKEELLVESGKKNSHVIHGVMFVDVCFHVSIVVNGIQTIFKQRAHSFDLRERERKLL